jgi:hypothetical protein
MNRKDVIDGYEEWLKRFRWSLFGVLTFRRLLPSSRAKRLFHQWIDEMRRADGAADFRWVCVTERGSFGDYLHFHILIGGLRVGSKWPWLFRWNEMAGECWLSYYHSRDGGLRYMLKKARPGHDFEIDMELP